MAPRLQTIPALLEGTIVARSNRFVLTVDLADGDRIEAYFSNTGGHNLIDPGRRVLVQPVTDSDRRTSADVVFVEVGDEWVIADAHFANVAFERAVSADHLDAFAGHTVIRSEPPLPDGGRADFEVESPAGERALVEVKSCTLVEGRVAKFPDRPTERGRRHVQTLKAMAQPTHVVFVVQRSDADRLAINRAVDPAFADALEAARTAGVRVHAIQLAVDPPDVRLVSPEVPITA